MGRRNEYRPTCNGIGHGLGRNGELYVAAIVSPVTRTVDRDVVLGTCTCTRVVLEYKSRVLVLVLATLSSKYTNTSTSSAPVKIVFSHGGLIMTLTGQLADKPTRGQSSRGLDNSWTGQLADNEFLKNIELLYIICTLNITLTLTLTLSNIGNV